ncbi:MAG: ArsR family transcriptional regulator [Thermoflexales bacterium]|nr:ArsR family transcriptional regulator [Thermoflexales bacterium]
MQDTRQQILKILRERGQATVEELSGELRLTSATIRHHLDILRGDGLVESPEIRRRSIPGRPQYVYSLTEAASDHFPQNYAGLADMIFSEVEERLSPLEQLAVMKNIAGRIAGEFPPGPPGETMSARLGRVVSFLDGKGYMVRYESGGAGYTLYVTNCPYRDVVQNHEQICQIDVNLFAHLLSVAPERVSRVTSEDGACVFRVSLS